MSAGVHALFADKSFKEMRELICKEKDYNTIVGMVKLYNELQTVCEIMEHHKYVTSQIQHA